MLPTQSEYALAPWRRRILWICFVVEIVLLAFWIATWHQHRAISSLLLNLSVPMTLGAVLLPRRFIALHYVLLGIGGALLVLSFVTR